MRWHMLLDHHRPITSWAASQTIKLWLECLRAGVSSITNSQSTVWQIHSPNWSTLPTQTGSQSSIGQPVTLIMWQLPAAQRKMRVALAPLLARCTLHNSLDLITLVHQHLEQSQQRYTLPLEVQTTLLVALMAILSSPSQLALTGQSTEVLLPYSYLTGTEIT